MHVVSILTDILETQPTQMKLGGKLPLVHCNISFGTKGVGCRATDPGTLAVGSIKKTQSLVILWVYLVQCKLSLHGMFFHKIYSEY